MNTHVVVGLLGATSPVGVQILKQLTRGGIGVVAFSRNCTDHVADGVRWVNLSTLNSVGLQEDIGVISIWIAASSIWVVPDYFTLMGQSKAARVVCVSSTSRFTKVGSSNMHEERVVEQLIRGEQLLVRWAQCAGVSWTVLRPTLIYGRGNDRNLSEIVKIIKKFRFFPLFGSASGLRQPIYVDDVASACVQAAFSDAASDKAYNISGAEKLSYKEMVSRVFIAMGRKPRFIMINLRLFRCALFFLKKMPRYKNWNTNMVLRMNRDMVFDHDEAARDFAFRPQSFILKQVDMQG